MWEAGVWLAVVPAGGPQVFAEKLRLIWTHYSCLKKGKGHGYPPPAPGSFVPGACWVFALEMGEGEPSPGLVRRGEEEEGGFSSCVPAGRVGLWRGESGWFVVGFGAGELFLRLFWQPTWLWLGLEFATKGGELGREGKSWLSAPRAMRPTSREDGCRGTRYLCPLLESRHS